MVYVFTAKVYSHRFDGFKLFGSLSFKLSSCTYFSYIKKALKTSLCTTFNAEPQVNRCYGAKVINTFLP